MYLRTIWWRLLPKRRWAQRRYGGSTGEHPLRLDLSAVPNKSYIFIIWHAKEQSDGPKWWKLFQARMVLYTRPARKYKLFLGALTLLCCKRWKTRVLLVEAYQRRVAMEPKDFNIAYVGILDQILSIDPLFLKFSAASWSRSGKKSNRQLSTEAPILAREDYWLQYSPQNTGVRWVS